MKKLINLTFLAILCLALISFTACGSNDANDSDGDAAKNDSAETAEAVDSDAADGDAASVRDTENEVIVDRTDNSGSSGDAVKGTGDTEDPETETDNTPGNADQIIDVDLTQMSSTMIYSEVYNMMYTPDDYIGKIIKLEGEFADYHDEENDKMFFACIVQDATACCSQGIEFVLNDTYSYPEDYPEVGDTVTVQGEFTTYTEGEFMYCTLKDAKLI